MISSPSPSQLVPASPASMARRKPPSRHGAVDAIMRGRGSDGSVREDGLGARRAPVCDYGAARHGRLLGGNGALALQILLEVLQHILESRPVVRVGFTQRLVGAEHRLRDGPLVDRLM